MTIAGLELLVGLIALGSFAVFVWSLYTILTTPESTWKAAGMNQWMWLAVVIFLPLVGSVLFVATGRRQLIRGRNRRAGVPGGTTA